MLWDGWMVTLSKSYVKTMDLLEAKKTAEAEQEFRANFTPTVETAFTKVAKTCPPRFSKIEDWPSWAQSLVTKTTKAGEALKPAAKPDVKVSLAALENLRRHFYDLHKLTQTLNSADYIHAFRAELQNPKMKVEELRKILAALETAPAGVQAKAQAEDYAKAKAAWTAKVTPILADGKITPAEMPVLKQATATFYKAFGMWFE
jgi:hypothetical protein